MYNERERLMHHQQLLSPASAAADLQLLADRCPNHPQLSEFRLSPTRHHDAILLELLRVADRGTIVEVLPDDRGSRIPIYIVPTTIAFPHAHIWRP